LLTGEHEVFYLQQRVGYKNAKFKIWKFVTMVKNSSKMGTGSLTLRNDPRVLPIGKFLRHTKINEIPQFINVLIGNMSMVGPRPQMEVDFLKFNTTVQKVIYNTKPGITGVGSIIFRDEEKWISNAEGDKHLFYREHIAPYKGELELWYLGNLSFTTDLILLTLTVITVFAPNNQLIYKIFKTLPPKPEELK
jgi:lipopolysaccharide/colanic/teichoic acid biosynthesis glycosyltransferase